MDVEYWEEMREHGRFVVLTHDCFYGHEWVEAGESAGLEMFWPVRMLRGRRVAVR